jgi:DMSO reductase anchor subunit
MRPTFSIIVFTVLSGAGYGLWFLLGVGLLTGWPQCDPMSESAHVPTCVHPGVIAYSLTGFVLVSIGLCASVVHLGRPERAWRALSQWRSSWLSREGIAALLAYIPAVALIACELLMRPSLHDEAAADAGIPSALFRAAGALLAMDALLTVFCTANIYASLKPIRAWSNPLVTPGYLLLGLYSGTLLLWALATLPMPYGSFGRDAPFLLPAVVALAVACAVLKYFYWREIDRSPRVDAGRATGLHALGAVRSFEQPHTEENYLTHEMGFVLARKHAAKLRTLTLILGFMLPALLAVLAIAAPAARPPAAWLALVLGCAGIFVERWLFFAEARHAVMGFYAR